MPTHNELRELVERWRGEADLGFCSQSTPYDCGEASAREACATELESLLAQSPVVNQGLTGEGINVDALAQIIRQVDGNNQLGAGRLAEAILERIAAAPAAPVAEVIDPESRNFKEGMAVGVEMERALSAPAVEVDEAMVERAAFAVERASHPEWTDGQFDTWWHRDPLFCERLNAWSGFRGTRKQKALHEARIALTAALGREGCGNGL